MATVVFTIAKATGWQEETILWMPLRKALQYMHASWVADGLVTAWRSESEEESIEAASLMARLKHLTR